MARRQEKNFAFVDSQNVHKGIESLGWTLDWRKFRIHLLEKYSVKTAYLFIGFMPEHNDMYADLQKAGFVLKFKPVLSASTARIKGNVDADLVLQAMIDYYSYDKAVVVTSDGDFYSLIRHLHDNDKLRIVLSPYVKTCSTLLKKTAKEKIAFMDTLRPKLEAVKMKKHRSGTNP
ncbi:MAG: NYN domain-containing protein [Candidatus Liptonbacteria bacterium]|nr:NYN domain-containing protein [Candidatus Liptonbacteria bacterium]